jgi:hypothetical protein
MIPKPVPTLCRVWDRTLDSKMEIFLKSKFLLTFFIRSLIRSCADCEYVLAHRVIEEPFDIQIYFVHDHDLPDDLVRTFQSYAAKDVRVGPGFRVIRVAAHDAPEQVAYKVTLWGTLTFYALILEAQAAVPAKAN